MPLCWFNDKMLQWLRAFNEWLVEHGLLYRSELNNETVDQGIKREISDMSRLLFDLHYIDDSPKRIITEWIVKYAMWFYLLVRKHKTSVDYDKLIGGISEYFHAMDDMYYGALEWDVDDMKKLTQFLNEKEIII